MIPRLITIPLSHYGERARWALDHAGIDYQEEHHLQMFSWVFALANRGRHTMPVLVTGGRVLDDSGRIVRWASERARAPLYPRDLRLRGEVIRVEDDLAGSYGVDARLSAYDWMFRAWDLCLPFNQGRAPSLEARLIERLGDRAVAAGKGRLGLTPTTVELCLDGVDRTLDAIGKRIADGRRYLFGDTLTAADITFAALSAPCLLPPRFPLPLPRLADLPEDAAARIQAWREHPAGQFAMRLYEERPAPRGRYLRDLRVRAEHR